MIRVFLSSTGQDLEAYRKGAVEICNRLQATPVYMEIFESMSAGASEGSKRKLDDCDLYVGFFAHRYGFIEPGHSAAVTEEEFDHAGLRGFDRICFVVDPKFNWPDIDPANRDKLDALKARVGSLIRSQFTTVEDFKLKLYQSLDSWLKQRKAMRYSLRDVFDPLFYGYRVFGGRRDALDRVCQFAENPAGGYLVITAPPGFGKTAFSVNLVNRDPKFFSYHFFTAMYSADEGEDVRSEKFFLQNVIQQMAAWHGMNEQLPQSLNELRARYQQLLDKPLDSSRALIVDALDEATWNLAPYFRRPLPDQVHLILTVRDVGQDWAAQYELPPHQTTPLALSGLSAEDVRDVLRASGPQTTAFGEDPKLLEALIKVAAHPTNPGWGVDPLYLRFLVGDIASGLVTAANLSSQPRGLTAHLDKWWQEIRQTARDQPARDLLGTVTAALGPIRREDIEAINPTLQDDWTNDLFTTVLGGMRRAIVGNDSIGYAMAHPRLREYMLKAIKIQTYQQKLLTYCDGWQQRNSKYAMAWYAQHLKASGRLADLYRVVVDHRFQDAQSKTFGGIQASLSDLRLAIDCALDADDLINALSCIGNYRTLIRSEGISSAVFDAAQAGDFDRAAELAASYSAGPKLSRGWAVTLNCYLIWEAATQGRLAAARNLAMRAARYEQCSNLCDALLSRACAMLSTSGDPVALLSEIRGIDATEAIQLLGTYAVSQPLTLPDRDSKLNQLNARLNEMEHAIGDPNHVSMIEYIDEERASEHTVKLRSLLMDLADEPEGQMQLDRALHMVLANPYPRYRDNALIALGIAAATVPDRSWARPRLQDILRSGLDEEGVTFTFDLASQLTAAADRRGIACPGLKQYLADALAAVDRWGTQMRAMSAGASALFWQGAEPEALLQLAQAAFSDQGFAGFMAVNLLSLASRCREFGRPEKVREFKLFERSREHAQRVRDPQFSKERMALSDDFHVWFEAPEYSLDDLTGMLAGIPDADGRRVLKDLAGAQWSYPPAKLRWRELKTLAGMALSDGTALDAVLGRLFAIQLPQLSDSDLAEAMRICEQDLSYGRPWMLAAQAG
jgi:hypothetical protein